MTLATMMDLLTLVLFSLLLSWQPPFVVRFAMQMATRLSERFMRVNPSMKVSPGPSPWSPHPRPAAGLLSMGAC